MKKKTLPKARKRRAPNGNRKAPRQISGLRWARLALEGPFEKQRARKTCIRKGLAYEKKVGRHLRDLIRAGELSGSLIAGQWFTFLDKNGPGWAQTDFFIHQGDRIVLFECKLTQNDAAIPQLLCLYLPLLRMTFNLPILSIQVCKNLRFIPERFIESPMELIANPGPGVHTWHYLGH